jgi:hypothetical protein
MAAGNSIFCLTEMSPYHKKEHSSFLECYVSVNREYDRGDPLRWPRNTLYPQKLVLLRQEAAVARSA